MIGKHIDLRYTKPPHYVEITKVVSFFIFKIPTVIARCSSAPRKVCTLIHSKHWLFAVCLSVHRYHIITLYSILHFHSKQTLLSQQYLIKKCKNSQPNNRSDVYPKCWRNGPSHNLKERFSGPNNQVEWELIHICSRIPRKYNPAQLIKQVKIAVSLFII